MGLPALDGETYLRGENPLGIALSALMRIPPGRRPEFKAEALRKVLASGENEYRTYLLAECVDAYLSLDPVEQTQFEQLMQKEPYAEVRRMSTTWFQQGEQKGREEGREEERRWLLLRILERRFGPLSAQQRAQVESWPADDLLDLIDRAIEAQSLSELGLD